MAGEIREGGPLQRWLEDAVKLQRGQCIGQDPELLDKVYDAVDFRAPCQILGFTVADPPWQAFVVNHASGLGDSIRTWEDIPRWRVFDAMAQAFLDIIWDQPRPDNDGKHGRFLSMREIGFQVLDQLLGQQRSSYILPPSGYRDFVQHVPITKTCHTYNHVGDLAEFQPSEWMHGIFKEAADRLEGIRRWKAEHARQPALGPSPERPYPAHGVFAAKGVRIGILTSDQLGDWYATREGYPGVVTLSDKLGPYPFKATQNGFLCIETPSKKEAHHWLNCLMAGFLSEGLPAIVVRHDDIASVHPPDGRHPMWGGQYGRERRNTFLFDQRRVLDEDMRNVLRRAEHHQAQSYGVHLPTFLEAHTHLEDDEPTQSFVFSWAIIEPVVARLWNRYVSSKDVSKHRLDKLEGPQWTMDARTEALQLTGVVDLDLYDDLVATRRARNRIFHDGRQATQEEAIQALELADRLLVGRGPKLRAIREAPEPWVELL